MSAQLTAKLLYGSKIGLEREALRVTKDRIACDDHPQEFGSALTHQYITTDYSESLVELVTPPCAGAQEVLDFLKNLYQRSAQLLPDNQYLWHASMPCVLHEEDITIAQYGSSHIGRMKTIYRLGLRHRYGDYMQCISGVHFNYSFSEALCATFENMDERYMGVLRQLERLGWLVIYLTGASPLMDKSFILKTEHHRFCQRDGDLMLPYATSMRMADIGYQNSDQQDIFIDYSCKQSFLESIQSYVHCPSKAWQEIGLFCNGERIQLSENVLQIENELYALARPKTILPTAIAPSIGLRSQDISYIELRCLDINPFSDVGIDMQTISLIEVLMHFCLFSDSSPILENEMRDIHHSRLLVATRGREPGLVLPQHSQTLAQEGMDVIEEMQSIAMMLDQAHHCARFTEALVAAKLSLQDTDNTLSARAQESAKQGYVNWVAERSLSLHKQANLTKVAPYFCQMLEQEKSDSIQRQRQLEKDDSEFEAFLQSYYNQYL